MQHVSAVPLTAAFETTGVVATRFDKAPAGPSIAVVLPEGIGHYGIVRAPSKTLMGRVRGALSWPQARGRQTGHGVRGRGVAIDYIIEALAQNLRFSRMEFFVSPYYLAAARERLSTFVSAVGSARPHVSSATALRTWNHDEIDAWIDPTGSWVAAARCRALAEAGVAPVCTIQHGVGIHSYLYDRLLRLLLQPHYACDSIICSSRASCGAVANLLGLLEERLNAAFGARIVFRGRIDRVPLCVNTGVFRPGDRNALRSKLRLPHNVILLTYIGYLSATKADLIPLLLTFERLVERRPDEHLFLLIGGTGPAAYKKVLDRTIEQLGLRANVRLALGLTDAAKVDTLAASDVCIALSDSIQESFGLVPIEAMACGVPQVVSDWDGYRDTVAEHHTGFLIPTHWARCDEDLKWTGDVLGWPYKHLLLGQSVAVDLSALQRSLETLIDKPALRAEMASNSRKRALERFSYPVVASEYAALIAELINIARATKRQPQDAALSALAEPAYFDCFRHFSSGTIDSNTMVHRLIENITYITALPQASNEELDGIDDVVSRPFLLELLRALDDLSPASGPPISVGELFSHLANGGKHSNTYLTRHLMWLIKYGVIGAYPG